MTDWKKALEMELVDERRKVADMCCDIEVFRQCRCLILIPGSDVRVLTSGHYNQGYEQSPSVIVNKTSMGNRIEMSIMGRPLSVDDEVTISSLKKIGLDPSSAVSFGTAAHMNNASVVNIVSSDGIRVSAAVTGGVRGNGGRAGDPASFDEASRPQSQKPGTIVVIVAIEAPLDDGALLDAMLVATQAKSCVLQELMARSLYSHEVATGSGTDQVGIICQTGNVAEGLTAKAGTPLGKAVAECVRRALFDTLDKQSGMTIETQRDPYVMLTRFGISDETIHDEIRFPYRMSSLLAASKIVHSDENAAAVVSAALKLQDEVDLGNISQIDALKTAKSLVNGPLLSEEDVDPLSQTILDGVKTVPEYLSVSLALLLGKYAKEVQSQ